MLIRAVATTTTVAATKLRTLQCVRSPLAGSRMRSSSSSFLPPPDRVDESPSNNNNNNRNGTAPAEFDIVIVGGGVVGAALARLVASQSPSLRIAVVEAGPGGGPHQQPPTVPTAVLAGVPPSPPHPRSYALSPASLTLLGIDSETIRQNERMQGLYQSMQVWEANQPASLLWSSRDLPPTSSNNRSRTNRDQTKDQHQGIESSIEQDSKKYNDECLGCCIEDSVLIEYLWKDLLSNTSGDNVTLFPNSTLQSIEWPRDDDNGENLGWVRALLVPATTAQSLSKPPLRLRTPLVVAADGANSVLRQVAGIPMMTYQYGQTALTCTVQLERPLRGRAYQRFLPTGPLALLPTFSDRHAVVVWTTTPEQAAYWKQDEHAAGATGTGAGSSSTCLTAHLNELLQTGPEPLAPLFGSRHDRFDSPWNNLLYGMDKVVDTVQYGIAMAAQQQIWDDDQGVIFTAPPIIDSIVSPRLTFPLQCQIPARQQYCVGTHLALVGDAAHSVHPMAGQGLNLGLQDAAALATVVTKAVGAGMSPGTFVKEYQASRRQQVNLTVSGIHLLQRLFLGQSPAAKHLKSFGMSLLQNVRVARRAVVQAATHGVAGI